MRDELGVRDAEEEGKKRLLAPWRQASLSGWPNIGGHACNDVKRLRVDG